MHNQPWTLRFRRTLADEQGNCFLYGCVTLVILGLIGGLIAFLSIRYTMQQVRDRYTAEAPIELPTVDMAQSDVNALIDRVDAYASALRDDEPLEPITLTESEINALLQNHPDLKETYGDHIYVTLGDGMVTTQMSLPLDWLPLFRDRYFNGVGTFDITFVEDRFRIFLESATVKGENVPEQQLDQIRREDFGGMFDEDPDARELMRKISAVSIKETGVTITPNTAGTSQAVDTDAPATDPTPTPTDSTQEAPAEELPAEEEPVA